MNQEEKARQLVEKLFADKTDRAGKAYVGHLYRSSEKFSDETKRVAAILHDVIEDTEVTAEELLSMGFSKEVVDIVQVLSNTYGSYDQFIDHIIESGNINAMEVKLADLEDNMDLNRLPEIKDNDLVRQDKYRRSYQKIINSLNEENK